MNYAWAAGCAAAVAMAAIGCGAGKNYINRDIETVVVLIPFNESLDIEAPIKMWKYVEREMAERGYRLVPRDQVEKFYVDHKFTGDPAEIKAFSAKDLAEKFNVDGVVYTNLSRWGKKTVGIYTEIGVTIQAELRDRTGELAWGPAEGEEEHSKTADAGGGWKGLLNSALRDTASAALTDTEKFAPGAASQCFASLPWAGWDPEVKKQREEAGEASNP
ncbi:MAG: DUF799 family lipoprotein [Planctomycetes bacterium]|nr:DUF799 family lipoprotein [Planctomycetota bacterium]